MRGTSLLSLVLFASLSACGARSYPGSQDDSFDGTPVDGVSGQGGSSGSGTAGSGTAGKGGGSAGVSSGGASGAASGGVAGVGGVAAAGSPGTGGVSAAGKGGGPSSGGAAGKGGGTAGAGNTGNVGPCTSCVQSALTDDELCPQQRNACEKTNGCGQFSECMQEAGCLDEGGLNQCAQQNGCKGSQQARNAFRNLARCLACDSCTGECPQLTQQCGGPGPGGGGGPGAGGGPGGNLEQQCNECQGSALDTCGQQYQGCLDNKGCSSILECFNQCAPDDDQCLNGCWENNPEGQPAYYSLYYCFICTACGDSCGVLVGGGVCQSPPPPGM